MTDYHLDIAPRNQHWRKYQQRLRRSSRKSKTLERGRWFIAMLIPVLLCIVGFKAALSNGWFEGLSHISARTEQQDRPYGLFDEAALKDVIDADAIAENPDGGFGFTYKGERFFMVSTLDPALQHYMEKKIGAARSPAVGFVAMDPVSGRILSMVGCNHTGDAGDMCLHSVFPAASVFKIVSATAAIERCGLSAGSTLSFNGRGHTLYRKQLTSATNRYTNRISLRDSFARSINPAFGKLGIFFLKKDLLEEYAQRFGFNQTIAGEMAVEQSRFSIDDDPYHWAELASGFNRKTRISTLHGAIIASAVVNGGWFVEPRIIERITDSRAEAVYSGRRPASRRVMSDQTSREMMRLMAATIARGTARRAFKGYRRDRVLSKLVLGGKTGSIKNDDDHWLYDWFVGYGAQKKGAKKLALAVLVVHDELLRARAQEYARLALRYYFARCAS